ncbi:NepR family anti-sigma factor [Microvirga sp. 0TCS3.31]
MAALLGSDMAEGVPHAPGVQGILTVSGEADVSTNKPNDGTVLAEPDSLEDLLNTTGDPGPEPSLPPHVANFLGEQLQAYYAQLMNEPVPDRFVQLLAQLDGKRSGQDGE